MNKNVIILLTTFCYLCKPRDSWVAQVIIQNYWVENHPICMMMSCVGFDVYKIFGAPPTPPSPTIFSEPPFWESFWILFQWSQIHKATLQWDLVEAGGLMLMFPVWVRLRYGTLVWRRHCDHFFIRPLFSGETPLSEGLLLSGLISRSQTRRYFRGGGGGITIGILR